MAIYRIEHSANGHGPFVNEAISVYMKHAIIDGNPEYLHPTPDTEFYHIRDGFDSSNLLFAFVSMDAMKSVFPCEKGRKALENEGYILVQIEDANIVWSSGVQCAFVENTGFKIKIEM